MNIDSSYIIPCHWLDNMLILYYITDNTLKITE